MTKAELRKRLAEAGDRRDWNECNRLEALLAKHTGDDPTPLISLSEWDSMRSKIYQRASPGPVLNGIACPECGKELVDSQPNAELTSYPPQKNVKCPSCGWKGYRIS